MNLAHLGVSTRGGVNQPLACPGVRAHRDPGALGGHRGVLPRSIEIVEAVQCAWDIWRVALIWRRGGAFLIQRSLNKLALSVIEDE